MRASDDAGLYVGMRMRVGHATASQRKESRGLPLEWLKGPRCNVLCTGMSAEILVEWQLQEWR